MIQIVQVPDQDRWEARSEGGDVVGYLSYARTGSTVDLQHTVVDPQHRGQGLAGQLVEQAMQHARSAGLTVVPSCPYVPRYLAEHPEHADLVDPRRVEPVEIRDQSIRLGQLLKLAGVVPDGAMARMVIENGEVRVEGEIVTRRGTQVHPGQVVEYAGSAISPARAD